MLVSGVREMLWARRLIGALVPESNVLKRAMSVLIQRMCPSDAGRGKLVSRFVEAPANRLPCQRPTMLLYVRESLFHLRVK